MNKSSRCKMAWAAGVILLAGLVYSWAPAVADDEPPQPAPPPVQASPPPPSAADALQNFSMEMTKFFQMTNATSDALAKLEGKFRGTLDATQLEALIVEVREQMRKTSENLNAVYRALDNARKLLPTQAETRLIKVEHADAAQVAKLLKVFQISGCQVVPDEQMQVLAVSGPADAVAQIEKAVELLDKPAAPEQPKKNLELLVYILEGHAEPIPNATVPDALKDVAAELSRTFPYPNFLLLDTLLLRCRDGEGAETRTPIASEGQTGDEKLSVATIAVTSEGAPATLRLTEFRYFLTVGIPSPPQTPLADGKPQPVRRMEYKDYGFTANLDVQEGQKVVVGKANMGNANTSMFVVVTARVVDTVLAPPPPVPPAATPR